jgi:hypothetical protein
MGKSADQDIRLTEKRNRKRVPLNRKEWKKNLEKARESTQGCRADYDDKHTKKPRQSNVNMRTLYVNIINKQIEKYAKIPVLVAHLLTRTAYL